MNNKQMSASTASLAVGNMIAVLASFLALMISSRVLTPADFGLFAMAVIIVILAESLISGQLHRVLIQRSEITQKHISTMLSLSTLLGVAATVLIILASPLFAHMFKEAGLRKILPVMSIYLAIMGPSSTAAAIMLRDMRFQRIAIIDITGSIIAAVVAIVLVLMFQSVWALVWMELARRFVRLVMFVFYSRMRFDFRYFHDAAIEMYDYSRKAVMGGVLTTIERVLPGLLVGYSLGTTALGYYNQAFRLLEQALTVLVKPISSVSFPVFAQAQGDMSLVRAQLKKAVSLAAITAAPAFGGGIIAAPTLVPLVLGDQWLAVIPLVQIAFMTGIVLTIAGVNKALIEGIGYPGVVLKVIAITTVATFIGVVCVLNISLEAVLLIILAKTILMWLLTAHEIKRLAGQSYLDQISPMIVPFMATLAMMALTHIFYVNWGIGFPDFVCLLLTVALGVIIYPLALIAMKPSLLTLAMKEINNRFFPKD